MTKTPDFSGKNSAVIVTGATGFIGRHIIPLLLEKNLNVVAIGRDKGKAKIFDWFSSVSFLPFNIDKDEFNLKLEPNTGLIHLAWQNLPNYHSILHFEDNLPKNYQFIKELIKRGVRNVLVSGTCF